MSGYSAWLRIGITLLLGGALPACENGGQDEANMPNLAVEVLKARRTDVPLFFEMVGSTLGNQDVPIRARVEGFLETRSFEEGSFVAAGDLLYTIDPQPFKAKLVAARSELAAARTRLAKAEADLGRIRPLAEMKAVSQQDLDSAVAQEAAARAGVEAAEAGVELAEIELSYTQIRAPIDGLIGLTKAKPGEFVGREPNPVVLNTLSDIDPIRVRFSISEREYLTLARGVLEAGASQVRANREDSPLQLILADGSEYEQVGYLEGSAQAIDPATGTFTLEATFPNPENLLLPGQFARVRAEYKTLKDAVLVPRQSVLELQGRFQVYVVRGENIVEAVQIEPGPIKGNDIVVESGLTGDELVIVEGVQKVRPGVTVDPQPYVAPAIPAPLQET